MESSCTEATAKKRPLTQTQKWAIPGTKSYALVAKLRTHLAAFTVDAVSLHRPTLRHPHSPVCERPATCSRASRMLPIQFRCRGSRSIRAISHNHRGRRANGTI
jgi:hypothetical protein